MSEDLASLAEWIGRATGAADEVPAPQVPEEPEFPAAEPHVTGFAEAWAAEFGDDR